MDGELLARSGSSERHNQLVVNLGREISIQFKGRPCRVFTNDMRVRVGTNNRYTFPDVVAVCGQRRFDEKEQGTLTNPNLIIEVLSVNTEAYDRGEKFQHYRRIESLNEYVLVSQHKPHVEQFRRHSDGQWLFLSTSGLESFIELTSVGCKLALAEIYEKVDFGPEPASRTASADGS